MASSGTPQGPFAASSGYQEDGDTGLKLLGHRYYDPSTGRFLTRDPDRAGRNWYDYCEGNPLTAVDPLGTKNIFIDTLVAIRQFPQTIVGMIGSIGRNGVSSGEQEKMGLEPGTVVIHGGWFANIVTHVPVTFGPIVLYPDNQPSPPDYIWAHEHIHQQQSEYLGGMYLPAMLAGYVTGFLSGNTHQGNPWEEQADAMSGRQENIDANPFLRGK